MSAALILSSVATAAINAEATNAVKKSVRVVKTAAKRTAKSIANMVNRIANPPNGLATAVEFDEYLTHYEHASKILKVMGLTTSAPVARVIGTTTHRSLCDSLNAIHLSLVEAIAGVQGTYLEWSKTAKADTLAGGTFVADAITAADAGGILVNTSVLDDPYEQASGMTPGEFEAVGKNVIYIKKILLGLSKPPTLVASGQLPLSLSVYGYSNFNVQALPALTGGTAGSFRGGELVSTIDLMAACESFSVTFTDFMDSGFEGYVLPTAFKPLPVGAVTGPGSQAAIAAAIPVTPWHTWTGGLYPRCSLFVPANFRDASSLYTRTSISRVGTSMSFSATVAVPDGMLTLPDGLNSNLGWLIPGVVSRSGTLSFIKRGPAVPVSGIVSYVNGVSGRIDLNATSNIDLYANEVPGYLLFYKTPYTSAVHIHGFDIETKSMISTMRMMAIADGPVSYKVSDSWQDVPAEMSLHECLKVCDIDPVEAYPYGTVMTAWEKYATLLRSVVKPFSRMLNRSPALVRLAHENGLRLVSSGLSGSGTVISHVYSQAPSDMNSVQPTFARILALLVALPPSEITSLLSYASENQGSLANAITGTAAAPSNTIVL